MKAFPVSRYVNVDGETHDSGIQGMDLRDYFAAKAMQAYCSDSEWRHISDMTDTARLAYQMADEMMKAREQ